MQSDADLVSEAEAQADTPTAHRLVIRVVLPKDSLQPPVRRGLSRGSLLLIAAAVAVLLSWIGFSMFRTETPSEPAVAATAKTSASARTEATRAASDATLARPTDSAATSAQIEPSSSETKPVEPDPPPTPIDEVIPDVPQSALDTIRGTVRVVVRVSLDKAGAVVAATADDPGPSRYFERLSLEAARKWTFTPTDAEQQRSMLLRFHYRRSGATAHVDSVQ